LFVTDVTHAIAIGVSLVGIRDVRAIVTSIADTVTIAVCSIIGRIAAALVSTGIGAVITPVRVYITTDVRIM
jgi:hypothetical protein